MIMFGFFILIFILSHLLTQYQIGQNNATWLINITFSNVRGLRTGRQIDRPTYRLTKHAMDCEIGRINSIATEYPHTHTHNVQHFFFNSDRWWNVDFKTTSCLTVAPPFILTRYILCCSSNTHCIRSGILACVFWPFVYIQIPIF